MGQMLLRIVTNHGQRETLVTKVQNVDVSQSAAVDHAVVKFKRRGQEGIILLSPEHTLIVEPDEHPNSG